MRLLALPTIFLLAFTSGALGQDCDRADESQAGASICAGADYQAADAALNKTYTEIVKRLAGDADGRKYLQAAQRAWIGFRDAECDFANAGSQGGSLYPLLMARCLAELTEARTAQLDAYLRCEEGDLSCPVPAN